MEEDVEIEMLYRSNAKLLMEAAEETNSGETNQLDKLTLNSVEETKVSCNKENETGDMMLITDNEENFCQMIEVVEERKLVGSFEKTLSTQNETPRNTDNCLKKQNNSLCLVQNVGSIEGADDQVNQHILDLIATDPVKYYLSQQTSYVEQFEEEDDDDEYISSDDDWDDDKHDDVINNMLEDPQFESLKNTQFSGNKTLQKLEKKALPPLTTLGRMLLKRGDFLSALENRLLQLSQENKARQKELQNILKEADKIKTSESSSRCCFRKFGMPYFSDDKGFYAPPNKDQQQKLENDEIMIETIPKTVNWVKSHKEAMKNAIKKTIIAEQSAKLASEINKLTQTVKQKNREGDKVIEKITEKQNELRSLYKKSFKELVQGKNEHREYDWMKFSISLFDGLHSAEECKRFWHCYLKPSINKDPWSDTEDSRLLKIAAKSEYQDWEKIAKLLGSNRSAFQCFVHFKARLEGANDFSCGKWSKIEDKKLMTVVNSSKVGEFIPWTKVSSYMGNRNHNQIYNRWANSLNPQLVKGRFTKEEDLLIVAGVEVFGVTFKELSLFMNNRTSSQIRERYERHLLPKTAKIGTWSLEEDEKLLKLVQTVGEHDWSKIASEMKTRTRTQVRQRYAFIQKMKEKKPGWTIAKVKRRNIRVSKRVERTLKDVAGIKKIVSSVEQVFELSGLEKETFLLQKLAELKHKISMKSTQNRGRKRKDITLNSQVNDSLLEYFTSCYTNSSFKPAKCVINDTEGCMKELSLLKNFFGHNFKLPLTEKEVCDNPRLSNDLKCFLLRVMDSNSFDKPSTSTSKEKLHSSLQSTSEKRNCTNRIDCPKPDHDDTIIMRDWWHTPPVNVSSLNFSEFFKRTVFDYSYGMHKDIWDSKIKRSQVVNDNSCHNSDTHSEECPSLQMTHNFPPNQLTTIGKRSILLSRGVLERRENGVNPLSFLKEELNEETEMGMTLCNQLENMLLTLFSWPKVLTDTKIGTVPRHNVQNLKRTQGDAQESSNRPIESNLKSIESSRCELVEQKLTPNDAKKSEHTVRKRKVRSESLDSVEKRNAKKQKKIGLTSGKRTKKCTALNENNNIMGDNSSKSEITRLADLPKFNYSKLRSSSRGKS